ncbi:MAG: SMC-Scp complex subunit ScpB [Alphaproteobacteria bacterium]|nr:SMC-Scp complex subunit ScpB [Alphaproteobacteria bacterium]
MTEGDDLRLVEALLFAAGEPLDEAQIAAHLPEGADVAAILAALAGHYAGRGITLRQVAGKWVFRTAEDLASRLRIEKMTPRKLSRAAIETLAIVAYHQPVTRAEVEEIRGVAISKGTFDILLDADWIRPVGRRRTPGRPTTWGTTERFLQEVGLASLADLPGVDELKAAGLLDPRPASVILGPGTVGEEDDAGDETGDEPLGDDGPRPTRATRAD